MKIQKTTDYNQFKILHGRNRNANPENLIKSIQKKNLLEEHPIICDKDLNVIDGQHRLKAAEFLQVPIFFIVSENISEEDISICQTQTPWRVEDFLKFFKDSSEDFHFIDEMQKTYSIPLHQLIRMCGPDEKSDYKKFRDGSFKLNKDKDELRNLLKNIKELIDLISHINKEENFPYRNINTKTYRALWALVRIDGYDQNRMIQQCKSYKDNVLSSIGFFLVKSIKDALISRVYNYKKSIGNLMLGREKSSDTLD